MFNFTNTFRQALLALILGAASLAAHAGVLPAYRVSVDTSSLLSSGFLDLTFNSFAGSPGATATISNLQGAFGAIDLVEGAVGNPAPGVYTIADDAGFNLLSHAVTFGGLFSFDLAFSGDFLSVAGNQSSVFSVGLLDIDLNAIGNPEGVATFDVTQLSDLGDPATIAVGIDSYATVTINPVPEPSEMLLMLTGLTMFCCVARRRMR